MCTGDGHSAESAEPEGKLDELAYTEQQSVRSQKSLGLCALPYSAMAAWNNFTDSCLGQAHGMQVSVEAAPEKAFKAQAAAHPSSLCKGPHFEPPLWPSITCICG